MEKFDVAVVGAGPAGISAAYLLASKGVRTIVFERGQYAGAKNMSGGVLYGHDLAQIIPDFAKKDCPVERNIVESRIWYLSKNGGFSIGFRDRTFYDRHPFNAFTVGRARFDRWFANQAKNSGALIVPGTVVKDLLRDETGRVTGVRTDREDGDVYANAVILADGINSPLAKTTGFRPEPGPETVALAVKELIVLPAESINERFSVDTGHGTTIEILGEITAGMDGIAVIYTNANSLSLCIGANLSDLMKEKVRPWELLDAFKAHPMVAPLIEGGRSMEYTAHWLAEGGYDTIPSLTGDGFLITGDSASLFNAVHREGSNMAMTSGRLAAETLIEAFEENDLTPRSLRRYISKLKGSYVLSDMKKYRDFNKFRLAHHELFTAYPQMAAAAAREMLSVDGTSKREKQKIIREGVKKRTSFVRIARTLWQGWRSLN
ncbi:MAG TPA: FAD-dependent oxidoreductase [Syntrophorhabdaceae bacterium]|nr:FAD-dependent oxidoreductase [Syntrophorhabdaceae bacterium]